MKKRLIVPNRFNHVLNDEHIDSRTELMNLDELLLYF